MLHLLYEVGRPGNYDIHGNLAPIIADRALRVFAKRNTIRISEEREAIAREIRDSVAERLHDLFGLEVLDLQIAKIQYSPSFVASVEAAVKSKNEAVAAGNIVNRVGYEAEQLRVKAQGEADAAAIRADGEKRAQITRAEAEAQAVRLTSEAQAQALRLRGEALQSNPRLIDYALAERWSGAPPQTVMNGANTVPFFPLGSPAK